MRPSLCQCSLQGSAYSPAVTVFQIKSVLYARPKIFPSVSPEIMIIIPSCVSLEANSMRRDTDTHMQHKHVTWLSAGEYALAVKQHNERHRGARFSQRIQNVGSGKTRRSCKEATHAAPSAAR